MMVKHYFITQCLLQRRGVKTNANQRLIHNTCARRVINNYNMKPP